jgi:hypothetical protein
MSGDYRLPGKSAKFATHSRHDRDTFGSVAGIRRADEEHRRAEEARLLAERLTAQLRAMGVEPEA